MSGAKREGDPMQEPISMTRTKLQTISDRVRVQIPIDLAAALQVEDRKARGDHAVQRRVLCRDGGIELEFTLGVDIEGRRFDISRVLVDESESTNPMITMPYMFAQAWNLTAAYRDGMSGYLDWPSPIDIDTSGDEVTIRVSVEHGPEDATETDLVGWTPARSSEMFERLEMPTHKTSITGTPETNIKGAVPTQLAREMEIDDEKRLELTMNCIEGRTVMLATPTDASRSEVPNSVGIYMGGPNGNYRQFSAENIAHLLGVYDRLATDSVPLKWSGYQGTLLAYVADE